MDHSLDSHLDGPDGPSPQAVDGEHNEESAFINYERAALTPHAREGYGFRPASGTSTPLKASRSGTEAGSPLPDPNGLGWPGTFSYGLFRCYASHTTIAKSTVSRFNATPAERAAREQKLASAVRTILECIGEDPGREGLVRTPERYSQALMWLTRGYEERLTGASILSTDYITTQSRHVKHRHHKRCCLRRGSR